MLSTGMDIETFITRWAGSGGAERANYGLFLSELCRVLDVPEPDPTKPNDEGNAYVFEKGVLEPHDEGQPTVRRIDLYKRGCFVLEAKQGVEQEAEDEAKARQAKRKAGTKKGHGTRGTKGWDTFMQRARQQAESYVRLLPDGEGRPPFVVVVDVGHAIEVYAEFTRTGGVYRPFPDVRSYRVTMEDLRRPEVRKRLRAVWEEPLSLDPSLRAAEVTQQVADTLARISRSMEGQPDADGVPMTPERVSGFLIRMIFTMFAEDVGLIPEGKFRRALETMKGRPEAFVPSLQNLWDAMARGGYSIALQEKIKHFNGGLFEEVEVLPVTAEQLGLFTEAAGRDWSEVEPSIFGTLVERALNPTERHKLGAHYTPRAYVERLVEQTVIVPLQADWQNVQIEVQNVLSKAADDKALAAARVKARGFVEAFVAQLQQTTVMDPACGTGNFLYVAMELIKRLEAEVVETLQALGGQAPLIGVSPEQFIGLELNPRAARVAELVLWIGYLQLYAREHGHAAPPEPILKAFHNVRQADAVLAYSGRRPKVDKEGKPVTRWDGVSVIRSPTTGQEVPDPGAVVQDEVYENPTPVLWPRANFIVGNPPFIGAGPMRFALGDGYTETLRKTYPEVPESADFMMFWWYKAAQRLTLEPTEGKRLRRFGFVTTNSLKQTFNRRVMERFLGKGLSLAYAVPDHPWVDEADGAAVRIAMTVAEPGKYEGVLTRVTDEKVSGNGEYTIETVDEAGTINADLTIGIDVTQAKELKALQSLSSRGVMLFGSGFIVKAEQIAGFGLEKRAGLQRFVRKYRNGKDLTNRPRDVSVIDLFGLTADEARDRYP